MLFTLHLVEDHQNEDLWKLASNYSVSMKWKPLLYQNKIFVHLVKLNVTHGVLLLSSLNAQFLESAIRTILISILESAIDFVFNQITTKSHRKTCNQISDSLAELMFVHFLIKLNFQSGSNS